MPASVEKITSEQTYRAFSDGLARAIRFNEAEDADTFCEFYEAFLKEQPTFVTEQPEWAARYDELYRRAKWVLLPRIRDDKTVIQMLRERVTLLASVPEFDLVQRFRDRLMSFEPADRDVLKTAYRDALSANNETVTAKFMSGLSGKELPGTVGNWIKEYLSSVGGKIGDALAEAKFYTDHKSFRALRAPDQEFLKRLFALAERFTFSSQTAQGYEGSHLLEVEGRIVNYVDGKIEEMNPEMSKTIDSLLPKPLSPEEKNQLIIARFKDSEEVGARLAVRESELAKTAGGDEKKLLAALGSALASAKSGQAYADEVTALFRALARVGVFSHVLTLPVVSKIVADAYVKSGKTDAVANYKIFPGAPAHQKMFLRTVFGVVLGMSESEAARHVLQIANILRKKGDRNLMDIAYYDEATDTFRFVK